MSLRGTPDAGAESGERRVGGDSCMEGILKKGEWPALLDKGGR